MLRETNHGSGVCRFGTDRFKRRPRATFGYFVQLLDLLIRTGLHAERVQIRAARYPVYCLSSRRVAATVVEFLACREAYPVGMSVGVRLAC